MKRAIISKSAIASAEEPSRGVFWIVDDELLAFPYAGDDSVGIAKSGNTYNHKNLWNSIKPKGCNKPYNYYPRGRVDFGGGNIPIVWMNPNIDDGEFIPKIKVAFGLRQNPKINYDFSEHYRCYLDEGWRPDR